MTYLTRWLQPGDLLVPGNLLQPGNKLVPIGNYNQ